MTNTVSGGIYEFVFGADVAQRDEWLAFWAMLGFVPQTEGKMNAATAAQVYQHDAPLESVRLVHPGCDTFTTGLVRLQFWPTFKTQGVPNSRPVAPGSRWMGMYTHDICQIRDSLHSKRSREQWNLWASPPVNAALQNPPPEHHFFEPFVGLREALFFGDDFRLAFIQRAGFDRPGFGTFDDTLPYKNTEGSHANVVQPDNQFSTEFYKQVFGYETAPYGEAHDSGDEPPTIAALNLRDGEMFRVERTRAKDCPAGLLQVYSSYVADDDYRDLSRAGSRNLCLYSVRHRDLDKLVVDIVEHGGNLRTSIARDEFSERFVYFDAPDGYSWLAVEAHD